MNMPSYMIEHRWVTKQVDVVQCGQTAYQTCYITLSNTIKTRCSNGKMFGFQNNLCSCLIIKHFPRGQGLISKQTSAREESIYIFEPAAQKVFKTPANLFNLFWS